MAGLKFRVLLDSVKDDEVFRDILIDDTHSFEHFYTSILDAFGLENNQMASFYVSDEEWNKGEEITLVDMNLDDIESPLEMNKTYLNERIESSHQRFILVYDFLSMWIFLIELHEVRKEKVKKPIVLLKVGDVPKKMKEEGANTLDDLRFDTDFDADEFDEGFNGFDEDFSNGFDNIDDYDI